MTEARTGGIGNLTHKSFETSLIANGEAKGELELIFRIDRTGRCFRLSGTRDMAPKDMLSICVVRGAQKSEDEGERADKGRRLGCSHGGHREWIAWNLWNYSRIRTRIPHLMRFNSIPSRGVTKKRFFGANACGGSKLRRNSKRFAQFNQYSRCLTLFVGLNGLGQDPV